MSEDIIKEFKDLLQKMARMPLSEREVFFGFFDPERAVADENGAIIIPKMDFADLTARQQEIGLEIGRLCGEIEDSGMMMEEVLGRKDILEIIMAIYRQPSH